jgi:hypothetical protein
VSHVWRAGPWWVAGLVAFNLFLHLPISDVFDGLARRYGFTEYDTVTRVVFLIAGLACTAWLWQPSAQSARVRRALVYLGAIIAMSQALIVVNGIEAIHYPQYALLTWLLVRCGLGLERSWLASTALGAIDEIWQWQTLPRAVPGYLDWDDILLNALGAALGVLIVVRMRHAPVSEPVLPATSMGVALAVAGLIALLCGPVIQQPFYRLTPGGRWFHLLSPFEAVVCVAAVWLLTRTLAVGRGALSLDQSVRGDGQRYLA